VHKDANRTDVRRQIRLNEPRVAFAPGLELHREFELHSRERGRRKRADEHDTFSHVARVARFACTTAGLYAELLRHQRRGLANRPTRQEVQRRDFPA
jgi:hypothetical protein